MDITEEARLRDKANVHSNLGRVLHHLGRSREAHELLTWALDWREKELGPAHAETILAVRWLAATAAAQGRHEEALEFYERTSAAPEEALSYVSAPVLEQEFLAFQATRASGSGSRGQAAEP